MSQERPIIFSDEEEPTQKLMRKSKESPFMVAGLSGLVGMLGYSIYKFKNKGEMSTSVYLMHTRVLAQGTVVSCLALGVIYTMVDKYLLNPENNSKKT